MIIEAEGYRFDFKDAIDVFKFDEQEKSSPMFHGAPMKAVDIIAEFDTDYIFIEIKHYDWPDEFDEMIETGSETTKEKNLKFKWLKNYLKYKFRDTYLYRHAEEKVDKPIHYLCLLNFDDALNGRMKKDLRRELPVGRGARRWKRELVKSCQVLNINAWERNFPAWSIQKL